MRHEPQLEVSFELNGKSLKLLVNPMQSLARVLRDTLSMTGTKIGCDAGDCGACTVLLDEQQCCSCLVPVAQCQDARITTIEGSKEHAVLPTLQSAFLKHGAAQCGICTPGMLLSATELLLQKSDLDRAAVEQALSGTLCRCTGYVKIVDAVLDASKTLRGDGSSILELASESDPVAEAADRNGVLKSVGRSIVRVDGLSKVEGSELYAADTAPEDSLWLRIIRSPIAHASFSLASFTPLYQQFPGLEKVLTADDVPGHNGFGIYPTTKDQPVFSRERLLYQGDAILGLVGDRHTVESISWDVLPISLTPLDPLMSMGEALADGAELLHDHSPGNILIEGKTDKGNLAELENKGYISVDGSFETSFVEHGYIEPEAGFARRVGDRIEVFATTQAPMMDLEEVANVLGIPQAAVRIIPSACGGGFGGKLDVSVQAALAVAAWTLDRPVRMIYNRVESMAASTKRHPAKLDIRVTADREGRLLGLKLLGDFNTGAYASWGPTVAGRVPLHCTGPYSVPNVYCHTRAVHTHSCPSGAFRGFGTPQAAIARELAYDQLASELDMDRWAFRHLNAFRPGDYTPSGQQLNDSVGMVECLDAIHSEWQTMLSEADQFNQTRVDSDDDGLRKGVGIACMWYGCGNTGLSNPSTLRVELNRDGSLVFYNGAVDIGQGSTTVLLQICADAVGLPLEQFGMVVGDTDLTDDAGKTSASRQTFVSGKAAMLAGEHLREQLLQLLGANSDAQLSLDGQTLSATLDYTKLSVDLSEADFGSYDLGYPETLVGTGTFDPPITPLDSKGQGKAYGTYAFAAQICTVEINTHLGTVKPLRFVAAHDVGKAVNPQLIEGQIEGGIVQGLGMALMEEYLPGKTDNLHDYLIPTIGDIPEIDIHLIESPEPLGPYGAKGVGEPALVPTPAAILSAIRHATGITMRKVPVLPHRLHAELQKQSRLA